MYDRIGGVGARAQKGSGASVFGLFIYQTVCRKISKIVSDAKRKPLNGCTKKYCSPGSIPGAEKNTARSGSLPSRCLSDRSTLISAAGTSCRGSILIEFAICMPILIILLFYINDVVKLKRLHSQTEFVAQQMANIFQNISQKREGADRKITYNDIRYAASLAYLSIFPGTTNFHSGARSDLGYTALGHIFCVQGNTDSTASVLWFQRFNFAENTPDPSSVCMDAGFPGRSNVKILTNASPSEIYPTLKINPGEMKIIVECTIFYQQTARYGFTDGRSATEVSPSQAFGLHLYKLSPPPTRAGSNYCLYFHSAVIFTPKPGLFNATPPAENN